MLRISIVGLLAVVLAGSCTASELSSTDATKAPTSDGALASSTVPATTSTTATASTLPRTTTSTTVWMEQPHTLGPLESTPYVADPLTWRNTGVTLTRAQPHEYWVGSMGDRFVFVRWAWPSGGLDVSTSVDGVAWSPSSLPETVGVDEVPIDDLSVIDVAAGESGAIITLNADPVGSEQHTPSHVLVSTDGATFFESDLSELKGSPESIAAGRSGFALIAEAKTSRTDPANWLYVSLDGVEWDLVNTPDLDRDLWWVVAFGRGWMAKGPYDSARPDQYPVYGIDEPDSVGLYSAPSDYFAMSWGDGVLIDSYIERSVAEHLGETPSFYVTTDSLEWWRLPFPNQGGENETANDYAAAWHVATVVANQHGQLMVLGCGDGCVGTWEFYGNSFFPVSIDRNGWTIDIMGDHLSYARDSDWRSIADASGMYDPTTETLTIVDADETIATISCDQMRQAVIAMDWPLQLESGLTELPEEALWHSYDGTSWHEQAVRDLFGAESYVFAAAMTDRLALAVVTPNGDRYVADPVGCALGLFPPERALELWIADLPDAAP